MNTNLIDFKRVNSDINGNPRYVCHYLNLLTDSERADVNVKNGYEIALKRARKIGGRKFNNKQYGGGIVFQAYNGEEIAQYIKELLNGKD